MAKYDNQETCKISATSTSDNYQTFEGGIKTLYVVADADVFIDFDRPASTSSSLLLKANTQPVELKFNNVGVTTVHAKTASSTANVYLLGVR